MKILQKICFVLLLGAFSSVYAGNCREGDVDDCRVKAEQGDVYAQFGLGLMYEKGYGVPQDYRQAVKWIKLAAEQGDSDAQYNLGDKYTKGQGIPQDYNESVKWFRLAAEQGDKGAQFKLGVMYANGDGVLQDYVMAHMYWNIAAVNGHKNSIKNRGIVEEDMSSSQIAEAQKLAREWMRTHQ
jgi:uncharacterized protein